MSHYLEKILFIFSVLNPLNVYTVSKGPRQGTWLFSPCANNIKNSPQTELSRKEKSHKRTKETTQKPETKGVGSHDLGTQNKFKENQQVHTQRIHD